MSIIALSKLKEYLDVIHNADDAKLQSILDGAEAEAEQFIDQPLADIADSNGDLPPDAVLGIMVLAQGRYQASPADMRELRRVAETLMMPHRIGLGV